MEPRAVAVRHRGGGPAEIPGGVRRVLVELQQRVIARAARRDHGGAVGEAVVVDARIGTTRVVAEVDQQAPGVAVPPDAVVRSQEVRDLGGAVVGDQAAGADVEKGARDPAHVPRGVLQSLRGTVRVVVHAGGVAADTASGRFVAHRALEDRAPGDDGHFRHPEADRVQRAG